MNAHGVEVFHGADRYDVARTVAHCLKLDLLPAGDAFFNKYLRDRGHIKAGLGYCKQLRLVFGYTAAGAAQGKGGADDDGVTYLTGYTKRGLNVVCNVAGNAGLAYLTHGVAEKLPVLCLVNGGYIRAEEAHAVSRQRSVTAELHGYGKPRLAAEPREQAVRPLLFDDAAYRFGSQRLKVYLVGEVLIGHDSRRIGVYENDIYALFPQYAAGLSAGVVKFRRLTYDDGAGAYDQHLMYAFILRHRLFLPSLQ